jgi:hypothetical protein
MLKKKRTKSTINMILITITTVIMLVLELSPIPTSPSVLAENFHNNIRVDDTVDDITNQTWPDIAIFGNNVYVVWEDNRLSGIHNTNIYFTRSINNMASFGTNIRVDDAPIGAANSPSIAVDISNGNIYVVWADYRNSPEPYSIDIYCANSTNGGNSFGANVRVISDTAGYSQLVPSIAVNNDFIGVVWDDWDRGIYFTNSTDRGHTFGENKKVNDVSGGNHYYPDIVIDENGVIHVVWEDKVDGNFSIYYSKSLDGGNTWVPSKKVSDDPSCKGQRMPSIAIDFNGNIYVVWRESRQKDADVYSEMDIYFSKSTNGGDNFTQSIPITDDIIEDQCQPSIAVNDEGKIFITWLEQQDFPTPENSCDIYFVNSTDGGITFSPKQKINNCPSFSSVYTPSNAIAVRGNHAFIAWQDDRKGDWDIYFTRSNYAPLMTFPISPPINSTLTNNTPLLRVTPVIDLDNDTIYYNFTISDQPDAESDTVYYSGWITSTSWKPPPLPDGKWYWHTYTYDGFNTTSPNWIWNFTIDITQGYGIWLYEGWNLISIPYIQMDTDLSSALNSINGSYDAVQWYDTGNSSDPWKHYHFSKPSDLSDLDNIDHKMGFWIHVTHPGGVLFEYSGILPAENQSINLYPGWNLVGYPSLSNMTSTIALNNIAYGADVDSIWAYNATTQKWEEIGPTDHFELGRGYWMHSKVTKTWIVPL